jgi:hypothetical protein
MENITFTFDNLAAEVSRYKEETLSPDNPKDNW